MRNKLAIGILCAGCGAYVLQRQGRRWGATEAEVNSPLPGDEIVPHPWLETTHAITIRAPAEAVWPWLIQMGYGRAGWYTNDWWYRLIDTCVFHVDMPRVEHILPQQQHLAVGDIIPDGPPGTAQFTVTMLDPARVLSLYSTTHTTLWLPRAVRDDSRLGIRGELGWTFVLSEPAPDTTRLILRSRISGKPALYRALSQTLMPPADFFVARLMLRTIKHNVERAARHEQPTEAGERPQTTGVLATP